jgi:hypothetical protein
MSRVDRNPWLAKMKLPQINEEWSIFLLQARALPPAGF